MLLFLAGRTRIPSSRLYTAIDYDLIYKNPCAHVTTPRRDDPHSRALTLEEGARLLSEVDSSEQEAYDLLDGKERRMAKTGRIRGPPRSTAYTPRVTCLPSGSAWRRA